MVRCEDKWLQIIDNKIVGLDPGTINVRLGLSP